MADELRIALAQMNAAVGDIEGNAAKVEELAARGRDAGAQLVVFPELTLTGYPPEDLLLKRGFLRRAQAALDGLAVSGVTAVVGWPEEDSGHVYNAAAVVAEDEVRAVYRKMLLPNYGVFDERRWFEPGDAPVVVDVGGTPVGITICEDIWTEDYLQRPLYDRDPAEELSLKGIDLLLNLSASPFHLGKPAIRREMLGVVARQAKVPVIYCNAVGGQDQLVFDGYSLVIRPDGQPAAQMAGFVEETLVIDPFRGETLPVSDDPDPAQLYQALVLGLRDYATKCGFSSACLGLSGGIDSALTAVIAADALGAGNVHGLTMPSPYSSGGSVNDSIALAENLGIRCDTLPISDIYHTIKATLKPLFAGKAEDVTEENIQARIRGVLLMAFSNKDGHLLLTTGNKSELAVGYCTIYGDMCGGLAVISDLPKTRVYEVCRWINRDREIIPWNTIDKPPSAELRPDQKDQDTLPPYDVLDAILELYVEKQCSTDEIIESGHEETIVRWIQRRVDLNEWKRQQAAPGLRVTSKAFGIGRRMPVVQRFVG